MTANPTRRFWLLLAMLVFAGLVINVWERAGEARVSRQPLKDFPKQLGPWWQHGDDERFDDETEKVLRADDYVARTFVSPAGMASLYIGYYTTQRNGVSYHSPLNCLPGSGWVMSNACRVTITPAGGLPFQANRYVIQNGQERALMIYWYQGRGSAVASEYWAKIYTVIDSVRRRRSDGALVRVMVPFGDSSDTAEKAAVEFAAQAAKALPAYVPN